MLRERACMHRDYVAQRERKVWVGERGLERRCLAFAILPQVPNAMLK